MKTVFHKLPACCYYLLLVALSACSGGGMSDAQVMQSLVSFCGEIEQAYSDAGTPPHDQPPAEMLKWTIALETAQLTIVDNYLAANTYPSEIQQYMTEMREGLSQRIQVYQSWVDAGLTDATAPPSQVSTANDAAMKATYAETQLKIAAGL